MNTSDAPRASANEANWWQLHQKLPMLAARNRIVLSLRQWFADQGFIEVETPLMARSPGLEVHLSAFAMRWRGKDRYLITSPEYHMKRLLAAGAEKIFYLGKAFRDDERGVHHLPEFTMLEWYRAHAGVDAIMQDTQALVALATGQDRQWTQYTVASALEKWGTPSEDPDDIVAQLVDCIEPQLSSQGAVFLTEYPAAMASLARLKSDNPAVSERFEAYVDGIELANGFGELTDPIEQRRRFEKDLEERRARGLPEYPIDEAFLGALERGMPPAAGIALGIDRLVMLALGAKSIDDVIPFGPEVA